MRHILEQARRKRPILQCITNHVTANDMANAILAVGGFPIMAEYREEVSEVTVHSSALVLNMGVPDPQKLDAMITAGRTANLRNIPVILDPVGCMVSEFRKNSVQRLLNEVKFTVIKGNSAEMGYICGRKIANKGVDACETNTQNLQEISEIAALISKKYRCISVITGATDIVSNGRKTYRISNGSRKMTELTGIGCILSGLIGAFIGADPKEALKASLTACTLLSVAGELSAKEVKEKNLGTASMKIILFDNLSTMRAETMEIYGNIKKYDTLRQKLLLYAITPEQGKDPAYFEKLERAMQGGITALQLREKSLSKNNLRDLALQVGSLCKKYRIPLIINDDPHIAELVDADGVHLGQGDMPIKEARTILGDKIIGVSAHNLKEALRAQEEGADYIGVGAVFHTGSKSDTIPLSMEKLTKITNFVSIPVVAIGGIDLETVSMLEGRSLDGIAVLSAIFSSQDIENAASELKKKLFDIL